MATARSNTHFMGYFWVFYGFLTIMWAEFYVGPKETENFSKLGKPSTYMYNEETEKLYKC